MSETTRPEFRVADKGLGLYAYGDSEEAAKERLGQALDFMLDMLNEKAGFDAVKARVRRAMLANLADHTAALALEDAVAALRYIAHDPEPHTSIAKPVHRYEQKAHDFFAAHPDLTTEGGAGQA